MANLRANNLTGTGGRNALDGSVFFDGISYLSLAANTDFAMGTGAFTVECWIYTTDYSHAEGGYSQRVFDSNGGQLGWYITSDGTGLTGSLVSGTDERSTYTPGLNVWTHIALARSGTTVKAFVNGVEVDSTTNSGSVASSGAFIVGAKSSTQGAFKGYISNLRVIKGSALYTAAFTPPTEKLTAVDGTVLLCCQDSDDPLQEATGKTITGHGSLSAPNINLVPNGDFTNGTTSWTAGGSNNHSVTGTVMRVSNDSSTNGRSTGSAFDTDKGAVYRIKYNAVNSSSANFRLEIRQANGAGSEQDFQATSAGPKEYYFRATESQHSVVIYAIGSGTSWAEYANIRVEAVTNYANAPKVLPSVGIDEGVTFGGDTKINSPNYMYFPTGDTTQRGRGRGLYGGGAFDASTSPANIAYIDVPSSGNTTTFGELTQSSRCWIKGMGSSTRAIFAVGCGSPGSPIQNVIDYVTIAITSNATDFGDATFAGFARGSQSSSTRGILAGGNTTVNTMDYITIATTGNAADFGDLTVGRRGIASMGSPTRAVFAGGQGSPALVDTMDYSTIATTGNAADFGNLVTAARHDSGGCSSNTRGIVAGGETPSDINTIQYITIASTGDTTDFGDLPIVQGAPGSLDNSIRGVFSGSYQNPNSHNTMNYITIATTGNATDFGDNTASNYAAGGTSDSHGGLS